MAYGWSSYPLSALAVRMSSEPSVRTGRFWPTVIWPPELTGLSSYSYLPLEALGSVVVSPPGMLTRTSPGPVPGDLRLASQVPSPGSKSSQLPVAIGDDRLVGNRTAVVREGTVLLLE